MQTKKVAASKQIPRPRILYCIGSVLKLNSSKLVPADEILKIIMTNACFKNTHKNREYHQSAKQFGSRHGSMYRVRDLDQARTLCKRVIGRRHLLPASYVGCVVLCICCFFLRKINWFHLLTSKKCVVCMKSISAVSENGLSFGSPLSSRYREGRSPYQTINISTSVLI